MFISLDIGRVLWYDAINRMNDALWHNVWGMNEGGRVVVDVTQRN